MDRPAFSSMSVTIVLSGFLIAGVVYRGARFRQPLRSRSGIFGVSFAALRTQATSSMWTTEWFGPALAAPARKLHSGSR